MNANWHKAHPMPPRPTLAERVAWHRGHAEHCACRPVPTRLRALLSKSRIVPVKSIRALLSGGDRRSLAHSKQVRAMVEENPRRIVELVRAARSRDSLVAMRAIDLLEKFAHAHNDWVKPHKKIFISSLADSEQWEVVLQVVRALPLFNWSSLESKRVVHVLKRHVQHPNLFVRAWSLDSLATFAMARASLRPFVERTLTEFEASGSRALASRARHIRDRCKVS